MAADITISIQKKSATKLPSKIPRNIPSEFVRHREWNRRHRQRHPQWRTFPDEFSMAAANQTPSVQSNKLRKADATDFPSFDLTGKVALVTGAARGWAAQFR